MKIIVVLIACSMLLSGCATIVHSGDRKITINTDPAGVRLSVAKTGTSEIIYTGTSPATVLLSPSKGYFKGQAYTLKLELKGYAPREIAIKPTISGWYFGSIFFGGPIGLLVVDPLTGAMWDLSPEKIEQKLSPEHAAIIKRGDGLLVILESQLTANERTAMVELK